MHVADCVHNNCMVKEASEEMTGYQMYRIRISFFNEFSIAFNQRKEEEKRKWLLFENLLIWHNVLVNSIFPKLHLRVIAK